MANALLIDHEYCTGCRSCEIACRNAHEDTIGSQQWGIHVHEEGPWKLSDNKWEWEYLPFPTHLCDLCAERVKEGRKPACVHHCLALCMEYGTVEEMAKRAEAAGPQRGSVRPARAGRLREEGPRDLDARGPGMVQKGQPHVLQTFRCKP